MRLYLRGLWASRLMTYRKTRCTARIAQVCYLASALFAIPFLSGQLRQLLPLLDQIIDRLERQLLVESGYRKKKDTILGNPGLLSRLEGRLQKRSAGEQSLGARRPELVFKLKSRVGGTRRCDNAIESVDGVCERNIVNLCGCQFSLPRHILEGKRH